jgi:hypothetical protein
MLKWSLGAAQVALLDRFGLLRSGTARAATMDAPSRLCVIYVPGGFRPQYHFWPMEDADVDQCVPAPGDFASEPVFFRKEQLVDLGSPNGPYKPLRLWQSWDPANPANRAAGFTPSMYGFTHFGLADQLSVLHGVDQGTADHGSAFVSAMCGVASPDFRAPALHAVAANYLHAKYASTRPLPFVVVANERGTPVAQGLPSHAAPVRVPSLDALTPQMSDDPSKNPWWTSLNTRSAQPETDVRGQPLGGMLKTTALEQHTLAQPGKFLGRSNAKVDGFLESLHGSLRSVSRVLAADVVSVLEAQKGIDALTTNRPAYLANYLNTAFSYTFGNANFHMTGLEPRLDMALRLLKSDLTSRGSGTRSVVHTAARRWIWSRGFWVSSRPRRRRGCPARRCSMTRWWWCSRSSVANGRRRVRARSTCPMGITRSRACCTRVGTWRAIDRWAATIDAASVWRRRSSKRTTSRRCGCRALPTRSPRRCASWGSSSTSSSSPAATGK